MGQRTASTNPQCSHHWLFLFDRYPSRFERMRQKARVGMRATIFNACGVGVLGFEVGDEVACVVQDGVLVGGGWVVVHLRVRRCPTVTCGYVSVRRDAYVDDEGCFRTVDVVCCDGLLRRRRLRRSRRPVRALRVWLLLG
jgi:hypothetical protein